MALLTVCTLLSLAPGPITRIHDKWELLFNRDDEASSDADDDDDARLCYKYYRSDRILGKLYRAVDEEKIWHEDVRRVPTGGSSFWDDFLNMVNNRIAALRVAAEVDWTAKAGIAKHMRQVYEDNLVDTMWYFSEHLAQPLSELEVFTGSIISQESGASPNQRQRDRSRKLRDEFDRIASKTVGQLLDPANMGAYATDKDVLELCLASVYVRCLKEGWTGQVRGRKGDGGLESFRVVAACALMREIERWEKGYRDTEEPDGIDDIAGKRRLWRRIMPA
jgi:hypothetical protein